MEERKSTRLSLSLVWTPLMTGAAIRHQRLQPRSDPTALAGNSVGGTLGRWAESMNPTTPDEVFWLMDGYVASAAVGAANRLAG